MGNSRLRKKVKRATRRKKLAKAKRRRAKKDAEPTSYGVIWARKSTNEQQSLAWQISECEKQAKSEGCRIIKTFSAQETGWIKGSKKSFSQLLEFLEDKKKAYNSELRLYVWKLDRLSRDLVATIPLLRQMYQCGYPTLRVVQDSSLRLYDAVEDLHRVLEQLVRSEVKEQITSYSKLHTKK